MSNTVAFLAAATALALQALAPRAADAQPPAIALAGAPSAESSPLANLPDRGGSDSGLPGPADVGSAPPETGHARECYAKVKFGAQYGVAPPSGPQYSWRQQPGPPGAPGPIWCLVPEVGAPRQILISPERFGWIRVLCDTEATPARIVGVQRQLSAAGVYQGPIDGRYDLDTTAAVKRFQAQRHIEDRGYLSYTTLSALGAYSQTNYAPTTYAQTIYAPAASVQRRCAPQTCMSASYAQSGYYQGGYYAAPYPYALPQGVYRQPYPYGYWPLTTFDTGVLTWPGKR